MMVSLEKNFVFIHVPKTAGGSLRAWLQPWSLPTDRSVAKRLLTHVPIRVSPENIHFRTHDRALDAQRKLGTALFTRLHSFAVIRNPYAHAVSYHHFVQRDIRRRRGARFRGFSFEEGLLFRLRRLKPQNQTHMITDRHGRIIVDRVMHFENLAAELETLRRDLGLPPAPLGHLNKTNVAPYQTFYCARTRGLVERLYAMDFALFPYDFESGAPLESARSS